MTLTVKIARQRHFRMPALAVSAAVLLAILAILHAPVKAQETRFQFGLMGDTGYTSKGINEFKRLLTHLNGTELAFVVHIGDFQASGGDYTRDPTAGPMPCTDESYKLVYDAFRSIRHPVVLTPGDNDWTDCSKVEARKFDPLEVLTKMRGMFFPQGKSLGTRSMAVESQSTEAAYSKFRENLRWSLGGVTFATLHIVGSNDNLLGNPERDAEHRERKAANLAWMQAAFAKAKAEKSAGVVLMGHANPGFENYWPAAAKGRYFGPFVGRSSPPPPVPDNAFGDYIATLAGELESYDKPVAYLHGDTHLHRIDKPLYSMKSNRLFANLTRAETFGDPNTHWVRVTVDPADPQLFTFRGEIIAENARQPPGESAFEPPCPQRIKPDGAVQPRATRCEK